MMSPPAIPPWIAYDPTCRTVEGRTVATPRADGSDALTCSYAMPKGMDAEVARQLYLTRGVGERIIVLNAAVPKKGVKEEGIRKKMRSATNGVRVHAGLIDEEKPKGPTGPVSGNLISDPKVAEIQQPLVR